MKRYLKLQLNCSILTKTPRSSVSIQIRKCKKHSKRTQLNQQKKKGRTASTPLVLSTPEPGLFISIINEKKQSCIGAKLFNLSYSY